MQGGIKQHGAVPCTEYKAVAVGEIRVLGIVLHSPRESGIGYRSGTHGQSGMSAVGLLNSLNG